MVILNSKKPDAGKNSDAFVFYGIHCIISLAGGTIRNFWEPGFSRSRIIPSKEYKTCKMLVGNWYWFDSCDSSRSIYEACVPACTGGVCPP